MTSSKFNRTPVPRLRPPICKAPFGSCIPGYSWTDPPFLQATADWHDEDPLLPTIASGYAFLTKTGPGRTYWGRTAESGLRLEITVTAIGGPNVWACDLVYFDPPIGPFNFGFPNFDVDPDRPFDSERLLYVNIPGQDYRAARILN